MRIFICICILLIAYIPWYALEYVHSDGSHISITTSRWFSEWVEKSIQKEIQNILPQVIIQTTNPGENIDTKNWEHTIAVEKIYTDASYTSVLITSYEYTGGAHGSTARIGLVFDTKTGKKLTLNDLYDTKKLTRKLSPIWQNRITIQLKQSLGKSLTKDEKNWIHDGSTDIQQYQSFVITPRTLIIYGQQYQHNAYAYGMQTLVYPRARLIDLAK